MRLRQSGYNVTSFTHYNKVRLARALNLSNTDLIIHLEISRTDVTSIEYFKGYYQTSPIGQSLAQELYKQFEAHLDASTVAISGTTHQILQLTKAPAITFAISKPLLQSTPWSTIGDIVATTLSSAFM